MGKNELMTTLYDVNLIPRHTVLLNLICWLCVCVCVLSWHTKVDAGHIYGDNLERQLLLRLHKDGKLKYQVKNRGSDNCFSTKTYLMLINTDITVLSLSCTVFFPTGCERRDVPSHCRGCSHQDELPSLDPCTGYVRHRSRSVRTSSQFGNVRHAVAAGTQPSVWHPEGRASHLGRRAALPDSTPHCHWWDDSFLKPWLDTHSFSCLQYWQKPYFEHLVSIKSSRHQLQSTNQSDFISIAFFHTDKFKRVV